LELINYLNSYFLTTQQLLEQAKVSTDQLAHFQRQGVMPQCSYKLNLQLSSDSFFGLHSEQQTIEYYAKGYVSWLAVLQSEPAVDAVFAIFSDRYRHTIEQLKTQGHRTENTKLTSEFASHLQQEWQHFLAGIYGLCTKTGLPEDIAAKEFAVIQINELTALTELSAAQRDRLTAAVDLLDAASSLFAPHERLKSSRHRLVNEVRRTYKLQNAH
jgi:nitrogen-specific signal transduction histidine kinase